MFPTSDNAEPGRDFDRICDRTEGKPTQRVQVEHKAAATPEDAERRLLELLERRPEIAETLQAALDRVRGGALTDTTATPSA